MHFSNWCHCLILKHPRVSVCWVSRIRRLRSEFTAVWLPWKKTSKTQIRIHSKAVVTHQRWFLPAVDIYEPCLSHDAKLVIVYNRPNKSRFGEPQKSKLPAKMVGMDALLEAVGEFGTYQKLNYAVFCLVSLTVGTSAIVVIQAVAEPAHRYVTWACSLNLF